MENRKLKRLMTDLAEGKKTRLEVDEILEAEEKPKKKSNKLNKKGGKTKSHKLI